MVLFSVIIPVFRVPLDYLRICLDSLTKQSNQECEFIILSDGAPEAECSICNEYATKDARFKFFKREHAGVSATRNFGINQAQGQYIIFVDSDDWIDQNCLAQLSIILKDHPYDALITEPYENSNQVSSEYSTKLLSPKEKENIISNIIFSKSGGFRATPWAKVFRTSFLKRFPILFLSHLELGEDRVFNYDIFSKDGLFAFSQFNFYHYRERSDSLSTHNNSYAPNFFLPYIEELKIHSSNKYPILIAKETVSMLYKSWKFYYNTPEYSKFKSKRILDFIHLIISKDIRHLGNLNIKTIFSLGLDYLKYKAKSISSIFSKE